MHYSSFACSEHFTQKEEKKNLNLFYVYCIIHVPREITRWPRKKDGVTSIVFPNTVSLDLDSVDANLPDLSEIFGHNNSLPYLS